MHTLCLELYSGHIGMLHGSSSVDSGFAAVPATAAATATTAAAFGAQHAAPKQPLDPLRI
jgi:hypothetical protein